MMEMTLGRLGDLDARMEVVECEPEGGDAKGGVGGAPRRRPLLARASRRTTPRRSAPSTKPRSEARPEGEKISRGAKAEIGR